jgi:hypothetical protein
LAVTQSLSTLHLLLHEQLHQGVGTQPALAGQHLHMFFLNVVMLRIETYFDDTAYMLPAAVLLIDGAAAVAAAWISCIVCRSSRALLN